MNDWYFKQQNLGLFVMQQKLTHTLPPHEPGMAEAMTYSFLHFPQDLQPSLCPENADDKKEK